MPFDPMTMLGVAGGALAATGIASDLGNLGINFLNYKEQQATRQQNERLLREAWARDDTARQRMVTDLEKAGLSKWLASGASPMTSSPVSLNAPQMGEVSMDALQHSFENALNYQQTKTQADLADSQGSLADASAEVAEAEKKIKDEELKIKQQELKIKEHDANVWSNRPSVATTDPAALRYLSEGANLVNGENGTGNKYIEALINGVNGLVEAGENPLTNQPVPQPETATSKQQKEIQKLKGKEHIFMTYQDWLDSQNDYMKGVYTKHPKDGYKAYQKALKKANK